MRKNQAAWIVLAIPVAPRDTLDIIGDADDVVCLATPDPFLAVGVDYEDFKQTTDSEVICLLCEAEAFGKAQAVRPPRIFTGPS